MGITTSLAAVVTGTSLEVRAPLAAAAPSEYVAESSPMMTCIVVAAVDLMVNLIAVALEML